MKIYDADSLTRIRNLLFQPAAPLAAAPAETGCTPTSRGVNIQTGTEDRGKALVDINLKAITWESLGRAKQAEIRRIVDKRLNPFQWILSLFYAGYYKRALDSAMSLPNPQSALPAGSAASPSAPSSPSAPPPARSAASVPQTVDVPPPAEPVSPSASSLPTPTVTIVRRSSAVLTTSIKINSGLASRLFNSIVAMAGLCDNNESLQQLQDKISNLQDAFARVMEQEELDTSQRARTSELDDYLQKLSMNPNKTRKNDPHWQHLIALYVLGTGHDPAGLSISSEACAFLKKNAPMKGVGVESAET